MPVRVAVDAVGGDDAPRVVVEGALQAVRAAGGRLPIVMANVNRALGPGWNIWVDQSDSLSQRDTGWIQLYCENNQEVLDTTIQAFLLAEAVDLPVMIILDAFFQQSPPPPGTYGVLLAMGPAFCAELVLLKF